MMSFFTYSDHNAIGSNHSQEQRTRHTSLEGPYAKLFNLHRALYDRMRSNDWDLHPHWKKAAIITSSTAASSNQQDEVLTLSYFRTENQARMVEGLMGIDLNQCESAGEPYRHPVIELRLTPEAFAIELVLSPYAWWDQQNLIGKLALPHHRQTLRRLISNMDGDYRFGFWDGPYLSEMHLTTWELSYGRVLAEWMDTFADGQDWLRFGVWYEPEAPELGIDSIVQEAASRIGELYTIYDFMLWSSNNNFHAFYEKQQKHQPRRAYAG
jgi:hypothetical protein